MTTVLDKMLGKVGLTQEEFYERRAERQRAADEYRAAKYDEYRAERASFEILEDDAPEARQFWADLGALEQRYGVQLCYSELGLWLERKKS